MGWGMGQPPCVCKGSQTSALDESAQKSCLHWAHKTDKEVKPRDGVQGSTESNLLEGAAKGEILDHCTQGPEVWGMRRTAIRDRKHH